MFCIKGIVSIIMNLTLGLFYSNRYCPLLPFSMSTKKRKGKGKCRGERVGLGGGGEGTVGGRP